jgi:hypothetical protein
MIMPKEKIAPITNLKPEENSAVSLSFKIFFELHEHDLGIGICPKLLPFSQLDSIHATQREPALENRFQIACISR